MTRLLLALALLLTGCATTPEPFTWDGPLHHYEVCRPIMYGVGRCTTY